MSALTSRDSALVIWQLFVILALLYTSLCAGQTHGVMHFPK